MKAVRFSLPAGRDGYEEIGGTNSEFGEEVRGYVEPGSRNGSQQHLTERETGREKTTEQKTVSSLLCGLCCSKAPSVSVWNCDGEILSATEILCR